MARKGKVFFKDVFAGIISETEDGYRFQYDEVYLSGAENQPISLTMPLSEKPYESKTMLPVFDGIIPEGWLMDIVQKNWKINPADRMGLLLLFCKDCVGALCVVDDTGQVSNEE